ncbi:type II secretion system minor pseudopilin GspI [Marinobacter sp.]|uniref:type II secretion system minor pseudopilin GspI n=1 Tax=Marinobacter sp. TaxID=50741 RepID=UPI00384CB7E2
MKRRTAGFTLIEVLVALLVFGLIAAAASEVGSQYIGTYERIRDRTLATWVAENRMAELRLEQEFPGISENSEEQEYGPWRWLVTTSVSGTEEPSIRRVDVNVARFTGDQDEARSVHTLSGFIGEQK